MPGPLLVPLIMAGISAASQAFGIGKAAKEGKRQRELGQGYLDKANQMNASLGDRPQMQMPQSQNDFMSLMNLNRRQEMPGMSAMKADVRQAGAATRGAAANLSGADAAAVLLGEGQDRMRGLRQIGIAASQYGQQQEMAYAGALQNNAQWQQQMWQQNQLAPWEIGKNEAMGYENMANTYLGRGSDTGAAAGIIGANMFSGWANQQTQNPNSLMNTMQWGQGGGQPQYSAAGVSQGMAYPDRPAYGAPQGTYDQLPFGQ